MYKSFSSKGKRKKSLQSDLSNAALLRCMKSAALDSSFDIFTFVIPNKYGMFVWCITSLQINPTTLPYNVYSAAHNDW